MQLLRRGLQPDLHQRTGLLRRSAALGLLSGSVVMSGWKRKRPPGMRAGRTFDYGCCGEVGQAAGLSGAGVLPALVGGCTGAAGTEAFLRAV